MIQGSKLQLGIAVSPEDLILYKPENMTHVFSCPVVGEAGLIRNKDTEYNLEGIKKLLSNEDYFSQVKDFMANPKRVRLNILKIKAMSLTMAKRTFVLLLDELLAKGELSDVANASEKINQLKSFLVFDNVIGDNEVYNLNALIEGKEVLLSAKGRDIKDFILGAGKNIDFNKVKTLYGLSATEFIYLIKKFSFEKKLTDVYLLNDDSFNFVADIRQENILDTYSIDVIPETRDLIEPVELHPDLLEYVFRGMPENYSDIEKAIFLYFKLCNIFVYDEEFYAEQQSEESNKRHSDPRTLKDLTPTNNRVVCYEVNQIYAQLLKMLGVKYKVETAIENATYGHGHANLIFKANGFVSRADSVATILGSDLLNVKVGNEITGLNCLNPYPLTRKKFFDIREKVYDEFKRIEPSKYLEADSFERWQELYSIFNNNPEDGAILEKIEVFTRISVSKKLPPAERIGYLTKAYNGIFMSEKDKMLASKEIKSYMTIIRQKKPSYKFAKPALVVVYNVDGYITDFDTNRYKLLDNEQGWIDISLEELQLLFEDGVLASMSEKHSVPGIVNKKSSAGNSSAGNNARE